MMRPAECLSLDHIKQKQSSERKTVSRPADTQPSDIMDDFESIPKKTDNIKAIMQPFGVQKENWLLFQFLFLIMLKHFGYNSLFYTFNIFHKHNVYFLLT